MPSWPNSNETSDADDDEYMDEYSSMQMEYFVSELTLFSPMLGLGLGFELTLLFHVVLMCEVLWLIYMGLVLQQTADTVIDPSFSGLVVESDRKCILHRQRPGRFVAFEGTDTGRRFIGCATTVRATIVSGFHV